MRGETSALPPLTPLPPGWRRDCVWIAGIYIAARLVVLAVFLRRGLTPPFIDSGSYLAQARWLARHGSLVMPDESGARFFFGMPLLVSLAGRVTGEFVRTGYLVNLLAGLAASLLFYRNFPRRDWALWQALILPAWVATSAFLHSEAGMWAFALLALTALRLDTAGRTRRLLLVVGGYALACRPTAVFILGPMLVVAWLLPPHRSWRVCLLDGLALGVLPAILAGWTWLDTGSPFPQLPWQAREFAAWSRLYGGSFPATVFTWPGRSFVAGFFQPTVRPAVKLLNLGHAALWLGGLALSLRAAARPVRDPLAVLTALELAVNGLFILTIGGPYGHTMFYRYLATQANAFVLLAWLRHTRFPKAAWWLAAGGSVALASAMTRHT